ncbi:hypothetical protein NIES2107_53780 [Nostoc carneum NIES-2107]|nr:hypothetical protein NIES2107_53780 [Nostoc carneum NIES-2107]
MKPSNFPETIVWYSIIGTYFFYLIGGLYILAPVVAWVLLIYLFYKIWQADEHTPDIEKINLSWAMWLWIMGMLVMQLAVIIGHLDFNLGTAMLIKSSIGWAKGWALLAIFPLIGYLNIRPQLIYRAVCIVGLQTLIILPVCILAYFLHLPQELYVSPLEIVGGPGPEFFNVMLYEIELDGTPRWRLFTPWAPALGLVANVYFVLALQEKNNKWRWCGIIACVIMSLISKSRLALISLPIVLATSWGLSNLTQPIFLIFLGFTSFLISLFVSPLLNTLNELWDKVKGARAASTRVRAALWRIAFERWHDAPIWGHGIVERGPHLVEYVVIGSHSTWASLLFVKGIVGLISFVIPLFFSFLDVVFKAKDSKVARVSLSILIILLFATFGENLEMLVYLFWPGLVLMGIASKEEPKPIKDYFLA